MFFHIVVFGDQLPDGPLMQMTEPNPGKQGKEALLGTVNGSNVTSYPDDLLPTA